MDSTTVRCQNDKDLPKITFSLESGMSDKKVLAAAVKATGDHSFAKIVWARYPLLERMATAFAKYTGSESLDAENNPLLVTALKNAFTEIREHEEDDDAARAAFVNALLEYSQDVFAQLAVVETPSGDVQWMPFASGLLDFASAYPGSPITVTRRESAVAPDMARMFMIMKIFPNSMLDETSIKEFLNPVAQVA